MEILSEDTGFQAELGETLEPAERCLERGETGPGASFLSHTGFPWDVSLKEMFSPWSTRGAEERLKPAE